LSGTNSVFSVPPVPPLPRRRPPNIVTDVEPPARGTMVWFSRWFIYVFLALTVTSRCYPLTTQLLIPKCEPCCAHKTSSIGC
jgi:hypothetical protein